MNGTFVWFDLSTTDLASALAFYTGTFGWTTEHHDMAGHGSYTIWKAGSQQFGGMMALAEEAKKMGAPPNWMGYVGVENVDEAVARCASLGGQVFVPGTDIPNVGRFAVLADPQGAAFAIYGHSAEPARAEWKSPVTWHELYTIDLDAGWAFYEQMFGWNKTESMDMGPERGVYQMFGANGKTLGGMMRKPAEVPASAWLHYFHVDDAHATTEQAKALGATVIHGPMQVPGGDWITMMIDPQGAAFAVHSAHKA